MTGIETITCRILDDAKAAGDALIAQAESKAQVRLREAETLSAQQKEDAAVQTKAQVDAILKAADSAAVLISRNALLVRRRELIEETLQKAVSSLNALPDEEYIAVLSPLLDSVRRKGNGVLYLNAADRRRKGIETLATDGITLSDETLPLSGGFVLRYGELEMNCSFEALMRDKQEQLEDLLNRELFD